MGLLGQRLRRRDGRSDGRQIPTEGLIDFVEGFTVRALDRQAIRGDAAKKHSTGILTLEFKIIGPAQKSGAAGVLQLQHFAVLAEKTGSVFGTIERETKNERSCLRFRVFENSVAIAFP